MSNNRLYIVDKETGDEICIAKGNGNGWFCIKSEDELGDWLEYRDIGASCGDPETGLFLRTENHDIEFIPLSEEEHEIKYNEWRSNNAVGMTENLYYQNHKKKPDDMIFGGEKCDCYMCHLGYGKKIKPKE
jgi:hypothetical protein